MGLSSAMCIFLKERLGRKTPTEEIEYLRRPLSVGNSDAFPGNEQLFKHTSPRHQRMLVNGVRFGERYRHWEMDSLRTLVRDVQVWLSRDFVS